MLPVVMCTNERYYRIIFKLIEEAVAVLKHCHEVWYEQDRVRGRHQAIRADEAAPAGASRSQEDVLELLLDPVQCCFTQFLQVFFLLSS